jgi:hypothetical protein
MKNIMNVKCSKCGSQTQISRGSRLPQCCGSIMILDAADQAIILDPEGEYTLLDVTNIDPNNVFFLILL